MSDVYEGRYFHLGNRLVALEDIRAERGRQVDVEGWSTDHDDEHRQGEMAEAAACYILGGTPGAERWPWDLKWWKPTSRRRDLIKAGALIVAEIERLDRAEIRAAESRPEASGNPVSSAGLPSNESSKPKTAGPTDGE